MKWSAAPFAWLSEPMQLVQLNAVLPTLGVKDEPTGVGKTWGLARRNGAAARLASTK